MAAGGIGQSSLLCSPLNHLKDIEPTHCIGGQIVALVHAPKQRLFLFSGYSRRLDPVIQMDFQTRMTRHLVPFAAFLMKPQPPALAVLEIISNSHRYCRAHSREAVNHGPD